MMTPRERILAVYNGQKPDRVPYMLDLSHYYLHRFHLTWDLCNGYPKPDTGLMDFTKKMGLPTTMKELGIDDSQFEFMAKRAVGYKGETLGCLEKLTWHDVLNIYRIANEEEVEVLS